MNLDQITRELATRVLGWKATPDKYLKADRGWTPCWRFQPFVNVSDAWKVLNAFAHHYSLLRNGDLYEVTINHRGIPTSARGREVAQTITTAVARALGMEVEL